MALMWIGKAKVTAAVAVLMVGLLATSAYAAPKGQGEPAAEPKGKVQEKAGHEKPAGDAAKTEAAEAELPECPPAPAPAPDASEPAANTTEGTQPPTEGTQPPAEGTQPPAEGTQPPAEGTQPPAEGTQPPAEGTQPPAEPCTPAPAPAEKPGNPVNLSGKGKAAEKNPNVDAQGNLIPGSAAEKKAQQDAEEAEATEAAKAEKVAKVKSESRAEAKAERAKGEKGAYLIYVNGKRVNLTPIARNGRTLVPFRRLAEDLGATVTWEPSTRTVTMEKGDTKVSFSIGSSTATVNGETVEMPVPPELVEGSTFVPLRFIATALGADVDYDEETGAITVITTDESDDAEEPAEPGDGTTTPAPGTDSGSTTPAPAPAPGTDSGSTAPAPAPAPGTDSGSTTPAPAPGN